MELENVCIDNLKILKSKWKGDAKWPKKQEKTTRVKMPYPNHQFDRVIITHVSVTLGKCKFDSLLENTDKVSFKLLYNKIQYSNEFSN